MGQILATTEQIAEASRAVCCAVGPVLSDKIPLGRNGPVPFFEEQTIPDNQNVFQEGLKREKSFEMSAKLPHLQHLCILSKQVYGMFAVVLKND